MLRTIAVKLTIPVIIEPNKSGCTTFVPAPEGQATTDRRVRARHGAVAPETGTAVVSTGSKNGCHPKTA